MRILFFGSAEIGFPVLESLLASPNDELLGVVTQPDRPVGRKLKLAPCPVKTFAIEHEIPVFSPCKVGDGESLAALKQLNADLFIVVAYGQYIPRVVLDLPQHKSINLHPSLLPKYRGASPIQWAIANGDEVTGVTILYVSEKMDSGDILAQREVLIAADDTTVSLSPVLAKKGAELMMEVIDQIRSGTVSPQMQDETKATEVRKLSKEDGRLDWMLAASTLNNRIRGFTPWPGCFFEIKEGKRVKVLRARVEEANGVSGEIIDVSGDGPLIATGENSLRLLEVQPAGKKVMDAPSYLRGHSLNVGDSLI